MWTDGGAEGQRSGGEEEHATSAPPPRHSSVPPHTLVLGLGNPILGDDGVGWRVVEAAQEEWQRIADDGPLTVDRRPLSIVPRPASVIEFDCFSLGGLALMERLVGYDRAILVDAIQTRGGEPGALYRLTLDDLPTLHANSAHDASLKAALALGRQLGAKLPEEIVIYAIEAADLYDFNESLSPLVAASVGQAADSVLAELEAQPTVCGPA
jgi:hydrogenase maturation protease